MHHSPIAILSDIHSNLDALEAVCTDLDACGVDNILCLGDTIGYAAWPEECVARVRQRGWTTLLGNHDAALGSRSAKEEMNDVAAAGIDYAEKVLRPESRAWLEELPRIVSRPGMVFTHASLDRSEEWPYIVDVASSILHFRQQKAPISFVGHTHRPVVVHLGSRRALKAALPEETPTPLPSSGKIAVNVGSVGQPRDEDPRACYVLYRPDQQEVEFRRVEYDVKAAQKAIRRAGLPAFAAKRLGAGI